MQPFQVAVKPVAFDVTLDPTQAVDEGHKATVKDVEELTDALGTLRDNLVAVRSHSSYPAFHVFTYKSRIHDVLAP